MDLLKFQINEIESANLQPGEDEKLITLKMFWLTEKNLPNPGKCI